MCLKLVQMCLELVQIIPTSPNVSRSWSRCTPRSLRRRLLPFTWRPSLLGPFVRQNALSYAAVGCLNSAFVVFCGTVSLIRFLFALIKSTFQRARVENVIFWNFENEVAKKIPCGTHHRVQRCPDDKNFNTDEVRVWTRQGANASTSAKKFGRQYLFAWTFLLKFDN